MITPPALEKLGRSLEVGSNSTTPQLMQRRQACILTLLRVLDNILSDPQRSNAKTRKIKVDNAVFWKRAGKWAGSIDFLVSCGFSALGSAAQLGSGVPQHLKLESEDDARRETLVQGRAGLVQFAVQTLGIDEKSLPPCPVQPAKKESSNATSKVEETTKATMVGESGGAKKEGIKAGNPLNISKTAVQLKNNSSKNDTGGSATKLPDVRTNSTDGQTPKSNNAITVVNKMGANQTSAAASNIPKSAPKQSNATKKPSDAMKQAASNAPNSLSAKVDEFQKRLNAPQNKISSAPITEKSESPAQGTTNLSSTVEELKQRINATENGKTATNSEKPLAPTSPSPTKPTVSAMVKTGIASKDSASTHISMQQALPNQDFAYSQINGEARQKSPQKTKTTRAEPDEMSDLLDEIEFELNSHGDASVGSVGDDAIPLKGPLKKLQPQKLDAAEPVFLPTEGAIPKEASLDTEQQCKSSSSEEGSDGPIVPSSSSPNIGNRIRLEQKVKNGELKPDNRVDRVPGDGVNGKDSYVPLSQSMSDFLEPSTDNVQSAAESNSQPTTCPSKPEEIVDGVMEISPDGGTSGAVLAQDSGAKNTPGVEEDIANLLSDLESDVNFFSTDVMVEKIEASAEKNTTTSEQAQENRGCNKEKEEVSDTAIEGEPAQEGADATEKEESDKNDQGATPDDGSAITETPNHKVNKAYFDLLRNIPLPDGELGSPDGEDATTFRLGFELCHRAMFSIWPISDIDIENEKLNSKNPDRSMWSYLQSSRVASGLSNLNQWKDPSDERRGIVREADPKIEKSASDQEHRKQSQKDSEPVILVPLAFVYEAWACILGLKSPNSQSSQESVDAGTRSGTMYTWTLSNDTSLATLDDVPIDTPSLNYETHLPETSIAVCNYVSSVLRQNSLISLYGADTTGDNISPSSKLAFYVGIERKIFKDIVDNPIALVLDEHLLRGCHDVLTKSVQPRCKKYFGEDNNATTNESCDISNPFIWYCCRYSLHHLLASGRFEESQALLMNEKFIRARLQSTGFLRGTFEHSRECAKLSKCMLNQFDVWRSNQLQTADERNRENNGLTSFSLEDFDSKESIPTGAPDIGSWKENHFKVMCTLATILREKTGEMSTKASDGNASSSGEYQRRRMKEEIGDAFQVIGESIGDIDTATYRTEEVEIYEEALQMKTDAFGGNQSDASIADTLYAMGCHHQRFNHFTFAQKCYEQALRIYKATLGYEHFSVARVLHNIGIMYSCRDERDVAMKCFKKSLSIRMSAGEMGDADLSVADSLCWMGKIHRENEELFNARECFMIAHRTKAAILGNQHPECADVLHNIGVVCDDLSLYPQSLSCYGQALTIRRANVSDVYDVSGMNDVCETLNCIANVYRTTGERKKALQFFQQSMKRRVRIVSGALSDREQVSLLLRTYGDVIALLKLEVKESSDKKSMLGQIGKLLLEMGKLYDNRLSKQSKAMIYFQRALEVFKEMKNYKLIGDTLYFMGGVHVKKGSHKKALKCFKDSLVLRKIDSKQETTVTAETYHNIGNCEAKLGLFEDCLHSYCEALKLKKKMNPGDCTSLSTAKTEHCMGLALMQLGSVDEALGFFMPALEARKKALGRDHLDYAFSLHNVGKVYFHQGKVDDAIVCLEEALRIKKAKLDESHQSLAETEHVLASLYIHKQDVAAAIPLLKSALMTYKSNKDCEIMKSDVFDLLGKAYSSIGINEDAILSYKHSLKIKRAILSVDDIACANVLMEIGKLRAATGDLSEALIAFKEVKRIQREVYGKEHLKNADLLIQVGLIQEKLDNDDMAFRCYSEALRLRQALLNKSHADIAETLSLVGQIHQKQGEHYKSISLFQEAITIYRNPNNKTMVRECADVCRLLGISQMEISETDNAFSSFDRCLKLRESFCGKDSDEWAEIAYDIGVAKARIGLNDDAIALLEKFVAMKRNSDNAKDEIMSNALYHLGLIKSKNRNYDEALLLFQNALNIRRQLDGNDVGLSEALFQIGCIHEARKDYLESLVCFEESLQLRQAAVGEDEFVGDNLLKIGEVHRIRQEFDLASEMLTKALQTYKATVGEEHLSVATALHNLGYLCDAKHEYREAMKHHKEGLTVRKVNLGSNHSKIAASLDDIAGIYQKVGENEKALKCLEESLRIRKLQKDRHDMDIATNLFGMGIVYAAITNNEKAMECYNSSLEISSLDGSNPKLEAQTLHQIGCVHAAVCNYRDALQSWRTSLSKYREAGLVDDHYMVACTLGNIEMAENVLAGN